MSVMRPWPVAAGLALSALVACSRPESPRLHLPSRPPTAPTGSELVRELEHLDLEAREARVYEQVARGNVPGWLRALRPVAVTGRSDGRHHAVTFWVAPDYLSIGSDDDFLRIPLSPAMAWRIADLTGTSLPTPAMSDAIWETADVRLEPTPIPPNRLMTTIQVFDDHQRKVQRQRDRALAPPGALVAGHKKDVVVTPRLAEQPGRVAIYGWHHLTGEPIQRLYLGHTDDWVDYSHGIRLVGDSVELDGGMRSLRDVLADPSLAWLLSPEGPIVRTGSGRTR